MISRDAVRRWVGVGAALACLAAACAENPRAGSALVGPGRNGTAGYGAIADVGQPVTFGVALELAEGERRVVRLVSAKVVGLQGLTVVGVAANGPGRKQLYIGGERGFPVPAMEDDPVVLAGAVVPDGDVDTRRRGLGLSFGLRRDSPGRGTASGVEVTYEVDGTTYRQVFPTGMTICAYPGYVEGAQSTLPCEPFAPDP